MNSILKNNVNVNNTNIVTIIQNNSNNFEIKNDKNYKLNNKDICNVLKYFSYNIQHRF
jgi:hypothetical protein